MENNQQNDQRRQEAYIRARQKTEELKGFYYSLLSYCIVIPILVYIWYTYTPYTIQWFWFPLAFWGFSLLTQGLKMFGKNVPFGDTWEKNQIKKDKTKSKNKKKRAKAKGQQRNLIRKQ